MIDEDAEDVLQVAAVHDQEPVEALTADGSDEMLGERVRLRRTHRRLHDPDAFAGEEDIEAARELRIAVADQEAEARRLLLECPGELARPLGHPLSGRIGGAAGEMNAPAAELDEEQDVQAPQRDRLDGEEVDREHAVCLLAQKRSPRKAGTLTCRTDTGLAEDLSDSRRRHFQAEPVDLTGDPLVTPARVLASEAEDELTDLPADRRSAGPTGVRPPAGNEAPVPAKQRRRGHQERVPARAGQQPARGREQDPVARTQRRSVYLASQHRQLMPKHDDLQLLEAV